jgi:pyruvate dehydrogenase E2 component (dihydrolipoamide acetyltransferase)
MTGATRTLRPRLLGDLRVWTGGEGPSVALVHGLGGSAANWVEVVPRLLPSHRVLAVDLPGHGASPPLARGRGIDGFADAVAGALAAAGHERVLVAGHSFGGHVAARLAHRHPGLVRALLLVSPAGISSRRRLARLGLAASLRVRPTRRVRPFALRFADRAWFRQVVFRPWLAGSVADVPPRGVRGLVWDAAAHRDLRSAAAAMHGDDPRRWLAEVRCPALVLWGAGDVLLSTADGFEVSRRLRARVRLVAGCGHLAVAERPDAVVDALLALEGLVPPSPEGR